MRFPSRLLAANVHVALWLWGALLVVVTVVAAGVAIFGDLTESAWEKGAQAPRWYALFVGIGLVSEFLPMYVAHGQTRRQFGAQAAVTVALLAPFLAVLIGVGYLAETGIYHLAGLEQVLSRPHMFTEPTQLHLVLLEYLLEFLVWIVAGALIGAGFYRWQAGGFLTIPVGVGLVFVAQSVIGTELDLPIIDRVLDPSATPVASLPLAVGVTLLTCLAGLALTLAVIRDVPLRNKPS